MKVLAVVDKIPSAISICAEAVRRMDGWFDYEVVAVHPKKPSVQQLEEFVAKAREADVIHFQYWKSGNMLLGLYPFLKEKKKVLTHNNPYDVELEDWWLKYDEVVANNQGIQKRMALKFGKNPYLVPLTIDLGKYKFQREYPEDNVFKVIMVVARIESSKGVLEVAKACRETKTRLILVGRVSDMEYMRNVMAEGGNYIDFRNDISEEELLKAYYESHLHICNSKDDFESGTLPILEAMACGVPVLTRMIGHVPDLYNKRNMVVRSGIKEDWEDLAKEIERLKNDRELRMIIREEAFNTVLSRDYEYSAKRYYRLYRKVLHQQPLVSVVIPTYNRRDALMLGLTSLFKQKYQNLEIIVVDDGGDDDSAERVEEFKKASGMVVRYIYMEKDGYGLARCRNRGVVESNGEIIVFMDDRLVLDEEAILKMVEKLKAKTWVFGDKGANKVSFVENFSCIYKKDIVGMGMFNEQMIFYGGMTRDLSLKMRYNGVKAVYHPIAKAKPVVSSKSRYIKKQEVIKAKLILWKLWGE